jgi:hypothetical protein
LKQPFSPLCDLHHTSARRMVFEEDSAVLYDHVLINMETRVSSANRAGSFRAQSSR